MDRFYFVGWGTLSLINAGLAQSKGRSGLIWWVASLFIGPIATLLIVALPRGDAGSDRGPPALVVLTAWDQLPRFSYTGPLGLVECRLLSCGTAPGVLA
jgi:hypothetical protein